MNDKWAADDIAQQIAAVPTIVHCGFPEVAVPSPPIVVGPKITLGDANQIFFAGAENIGAERRGPVIYRSEAMSEDALAKQAAKARIFIFFILFFSFYWCWLFDT